MTEYTTDPTAIAHYLAARARTAHWVDTLHGKSLVAPSVPPSLVSDTDDGLSSQDSDAESSRSLPPRMVLRYPDGRPDVPVSTDKRWPPPSQKPTTPTPFHTRPRAGSGSHGYPPSNPNIHSRAPSNAVPLYVSPPPPVVGMQPETIQIRPSPTSSVPRQGPVSYLTQDPHHSSSPSTPPRQRSMRSAPSSRRPPVSLQMIYTPPAPAPSSQSRSAPVSPTRESFQAAQPPPLPHLPSASHLPIAAPSPVYGFPSPTSANEPPPTAPVTHSRTHTRSHSYSSNHSYPHPQAAAGASSGPPSAYPGGSAQRQRRHSSRAGTSHGHVNVPQPQPQAPEMGVDGGPSFASGASGSGSRRRGPPPIVYAPSANSSSYAYNPPVITTRPPQPQSQHVMDPHDSHAHAHAHRMAPSISDPTPIRGSLGRNASRGRMFEHLSRTPSPNTAFARANEASGAEASGLARKGRVRGSRDKSRRRDRGDHNGNGDDYNDEAASFSSGSTYYVLPSRGQKIKVVVRYSTFCLSSLTFDVLNRVPIYTASKYHERPLRRAHLRPCVQVDASTPEPPVAARAVLCRICAATTATSVATAKATILAADIPSPIRFWQRWRRRRKRSVIGLAARFSALIRHFSERACLCVFVCSAIVEVRGGHAAEELVFLLPYHHAPTSTSNHQRSCGGSVARRGVYYNRRGRGRGHGPFTEFGRFADLHSSFPFRSLFSGRLFSAPSPPPSTPHNF